MYSSSLFSTKVIFRPLRKARSDSTLAPGFSLTAKNRSDPDFLRGTTLFAAHSSGDIISVSSASPSFMCDVFSISVMFCDVQKASV